MQFRSSILFKIPTLLTHSNTFQGKEIVNYQKKEIFIPDQVILKIYHWKEIHLICRLVFQLLFHYLSLEGNTFDMSAYVFIMISLTSIERKYI